MDKPTCLTTTDSKKEFAEKIVGDYLETQSSTSCLETIYLYSNFTCNEQCAYCWIGDKSVENMRYLTYDFVESFLNDALALGLKRVKISGGEPMLNTDICNIINLLLDSNLHVDIETNATLITQSLIDKLIMQRDLLHFTISLDSSDSHLQDSITNLENAYTYTIRGIQVLKDNDIPFDIVSVITADSVLYIDELVGFAKSLGANRHRLIINIQPIGRGKTNSGINIDYSEILRIISMLYEKSVADVELGTLHSTLPPAFVPLESLKLNFCAWGNGMCGIMPNGAVTICSPAFDSMGLVAGNLSQNSLEHIWNNSQFFKELRSIDMLEGICAKCVFMKACRGMCRIFAKAKYGSITSPYPFCQEMYERGYFPDYAIKY